MTRKVRRLIIGVMLGATAIGTMAAPVSGAAPNSCATIQDGSITDNAGNVLVAGFDKWGYNYQSRMFNGYVGNLYRPSVPAISGDRLVMKWSDSWLANVDCDFNGKLDRGLVDGIQTGGISRGWLTNHYNGSYIDIDGNSQKFTDSIKIVWVGPGGSLWGQYAVIQETYNDTGSGNYRFKDGAPGFGLNDQWTSISS